MCHQLTIGQLSLAIRPWPGAVSIIKAGM